MVLLALAVSCGGPATRSPQTTTQATGAGLLTAADVQAVVQNAGQSVDAPIVISVSDRSGNVLAVFRKTGAPATATGNFGATVNADDLAVSLARTAAFFSNDQAPLSSRTVRFISASHFPAGVDNTPSGALYGIENTNRGCPLNVAFLPGQSLPRAQALTGGPGLGVTTGKADVLDSDQAAVNPGGVPLFKGGHLVGGVGVAGASPEIAEFAAYSGAVGAGFGAQPNPPGVVIIDGVALPFVNQTTRPSGTNAGAASGSFTVGPIASPAATPEGDLIAQRAGNALTAADVQQIVANAVATANTTRAVIRLPDGSRARMAIAVSDLDGTLLALYRMPDATVFSVDVAAAKARNMVYFSSSAGAADLPGVPAGTAVTNRTIGFGAQPFFPSGISNSSPGPFFSLYAYDVAHPCSQGSQAANANQSGIVFFPGSLPLYKNGVLVGGLGVSGDGVDQDDYVAAGGAAGFEAPAAVRADQIVINNVRLPYLKFPRNPTQ
ncbi:MAG TPA: heme-binding protein [Terriglobales bacterium]|nr:heme-binding protein [Terriglobales bacterium]